LFLETGIVALEFCVFLRRKSAVTSTKNCEIDCFSCFLEIDVTLVNRNVDTLQLDNFSISIVGFRSETIIGPEVIRNGAVTKAW
jgi:hypothetical protein